MSSSASRTNGSRRLKMGHVQREGMNPSPTRFRSASSVSAAGSTPGAASVAAAGSIPGAASVAGAGFIPARTHRRPCAWPLVAFAFACLVAGPARAAEVWLDVSKAADRKIVLALPQPASAEGADELTLLQTLENDLAVTGYFRLLELGAPHRALAEKERAAGQADQAAWAAFGAELLLRTEIVRRDGRLLLRASLLDVGAQALLLSREDSGAAAEAARLAHRLSDAVVRALTGAPGISLTRIAATWSNGKQPKRVVILDYDGRNQRPLSADGVLALYPTWFPDGTRVAYVTYRKGRPEIIAQNVTTGQVRSLAFFPGLNASPAISPDGRQMLLVLSRDGNPEVYRMAVDGSELKRLTFTQAVETSPVWSPDGTQIALVSDQGGGPQIHLLGANGGRMRRVSYLGNYATSPDWSPRGDRIVFTTQVEGTFQLAILDPGTGNQEQLTFDAEHKENPSFAPGGRHVVYSQGRGSAYRLVAIDTVTGERFKVSREKGSYTSPAWSP